MVFPRGVIAVQSYYSSLSVGSGVSGGRGYRIKIFMFFKINLLRVHGGKIKK